MMFRESVIWRVAVLVVLIGLGVIAVALSIGVGARSIPLSGIFDALNGIGNPADVLVVQRIRVPRTQTGIIAGAALAVASAALWTSTRTPLADATVTGLSAAAALGGITATVIVGTRWPLVWIGLSILATTVAALAVGAMILISHRRNLPPQTVAYAGIALACLLAAAGYLLLASTDAQSPAITRWLVGSLTNAQSQDAQYALPFVIIGLILATISCALPEVPIARGIGLGAAILLIGPAVAIAGPIALAGLITIAISRVLVGDHHLWVALIGLLLGPSVVLFADLLGRTIAVPAELSLGWITLVGGILACAATLLYETMRGGTGSSAKMESEAGTVHTR